MRNRKCIYVLIEAFVSILIIIMSLVVFVFWYRNIVAAVIVLYGCIYFVLKIIWGFELLLDIKEGTCEDDTIFMGVASVENLDIFSASYARVYFDSDKLSKDYILFDDTFLGELRQDDKVKIVYYRRSRIILQLMRQA